MSLGKFENNVRIAVLDNASYDGAADMLKKDFKEVIIYESNKNLGFGGGQNIIFRKERADYYLVLNPDTLFEEEVIETMILLMEKNPKCGIASCKILDFDGKLQPNAGDLPWGWALINWLFNLEVLGIKSSLHRNENSYYESEHEVGWVSGNFMMIKKEVLQKLGGFNEDYFMYFEDVDICQRAKKEGFKIMVNPKVSIKHLSGGSSSSTKFVQWSGEYRGLIYFYKFFSGELAALIVRLLCYMSILLRIAGFTITGKINYSYIYGKVIISI
ncbi:hypothetical protein A2769_04295 [Candidatus Daviesbacteria bacterium RIFCSPHIGHO2_01_FULL_37_27]|nr:MAG: hypothetical protein A2769_04295 [Candidatus Daviesbacteria bacterium RIFCSPHIGHO2_01_FULL_37_27]